MIFDHTPRTAYSLDNFLSLWLCDRNKTNGLGLKQVILAVALPPRHPVDSSVPQATSNR
jgi:hypothetical protein